jgi:ribonuclease HII
VVAGAVVLGDTRFKSRIDDSKKLTPLQREKAFLEITAKSTFGVGIVNENIIDSLNILVATRIAMEQAIEDLVRKLKTPKKQQIHIIIDGNIKFDMKFVYTSIIRGDCKSKSIACGSIIAKVTRDRIMAIYDKVYPQYGFSKHKGYPTLAHRQAIKKFGPSLIHRKSFLSCLKRTFI